MLGTGALRERGGWGTALSPLSFCRAVFLGGCPPAVPQSAPGCGGARLSVGEAEKGCKDFYFFFQGKGGGIWGSRARPHARVPLAPLHPHFIRRGAPLHPPQPSGRTCPGVAAAAAEWGRPLAPWRGEGAGEGGGFPVPLAGRCLAARRRPRPEPPAAQPPRPRQEPKFRGARPGGAPHGGRAAR